MTESALHSRIAVPVDLACIVNRLIAGAREPSQIATLLLPYVNLPGRELAPFRFIHHIFTNKRDECPSTWNGVLSYLRGPLKIVAINVLDLYERKIHGNPPSMEEWRAVYQLAHETSSEISKRIFPSKYLWTNRNTDLADRLQWWDGLVGSPLLVLLWASAFLLLTSTSLILLIDRRVVLFLTAVAISWTVWNRLRLSIRMRKAAHNRVRVECALVVAAAAAGLHSIEREAISIQSGSGFVLGDAEFAEVVRLAVETLVVSEARFFDYLERRWLEEKGRFSIAQEQALRQDWYFSFAFDLPLLVMSTEPVKFGEL